MIQEKLSINTIRLAKVTYVHPEGQKMEVIFLDNGDYGRDVQLMTPYGGTDFGFTSGLPQPEEEGHEENKITDPDRRDIIAVVAMAQGCYIALGFLYPQITHMAFNKATDKNRLVERHTSDVYRTINNYGDTETIHPSNAFIRIGEGFDVDDLENNDFDKRWLISKNKHRDVVISIVNSKNADSGRGTFVVLHNDGSVTINAPRGLQVNGKVNVTSSLDAKAVNSKTGASGSFTSGDSQTIFVRNGVITSII